MDLLEDETPARGQNFALMKSVSSLVPAKAIEARLSSSW